MWLEKQVQGRVKRGQGPSRPVRPRWVSCRKVVPSDLGVIKEGAVISRKKVSALNTPPSRVGAAAAAGQRLWCWSVGAGGTEARPSGGMRASPAGREPGTPSGTLLGYFWEGVQVSIII